MARDDDIQDDDRPRRRPRGDDDFDRPSPRKKSGAGLIIGVLVGVFVLCCGGGGTVGYLIYRSAKKGIEQVQETVQAAQESQMSQEDLRRIGLAAQKHHDELGFLPNNSYDPKGSPLLSWRVHILPYLGEDGLYKQFKLTEPWDGPTNKPLLARMPKEFATIDAGAKAGQGKTFYRGFSHAGAMFEKPANAGAPVPKIRLTDVQDGLANTILVVEAGAAVEWTKPDDLDWSPGRPRPELGYSASTWQFVNVLMADGTVRGIRKDLPDQTLRLLITRNDGQVIPRGWDIGPIR